VTLFLVRDFLKLFIWDQMRRCADEWMRYCLAPFLEDEDESNVFLLLAAENYLLSLS